MKRLNLVVINKVQNTIISAVTSTNINEHFGIISSLIIANNKFFHSFVHTYTKFSVKKKEIIENKKKHSACNLKSINVFIEVDYNQF